MDTISQELLEHIEDLEGFSTKAYRDVNGVLTIGYGHTNATGTFKFDENTEINEAKAQAILIEDLSRAEEYVEQMLVNRDLKVNDEVKSYMVLVYFNRPWALRGTMEDIATMNADLAKQSQIDIYKDVKGEPPEWYLNRVDKEFAYLNEFDFKGDEGKEINLRDVTSILADIGYDLPSEPDIPKETSKYSTFLKAMNGIFGRIL